MHEYGAEQAFCKRQMGTGAISIEAGCELHYRRTGYEIDWNEEYHLDRWIYYGLYNWRLHDENGKEMDEDDMGFQIWSGTESLG